MVTKSVKWTSTISPSVSSESDAVRHARTRRGQDVRALNSSGPSEDLDTTRIKSHTWIDAA